MDKATRDYFDSKFDVILGRLKRLEQEVSTQGQLQDRTNRRLSAIESYPSSPYSSGMSRPQYPTRIDVHSVSRARKSLSPY